VIVIEPDAPRPRGAEHEDRDLAVVADTEPEPGPALLEGSGCRMVRLRRAMAGFLPGDLLIVAPGVEPEGGEFVIDLEGRFGRHGGGLVQGVVVGVVRKGAAAR